MDDKGKARGFPGSLADANESGVAFILVDLDTALTFMDVAATSEIQENVERNHRNARNAYDTALHLLTLVRPDASQRKTIEDKLATLKARLEAVGYRF